MLALCSVEYICCCCRCSVGVWEENRKVLVLLATYLFSFSGGYFVVRIGIPRTGWYLPCPDFFSNFQFFIYHVLCNVELPKTRNPEPIQAVSNLRKRRREKRKLPHFPFNITKRADQRGILQVSSTYSRSRLSFRRPSPSFAISHAFLGAFP